MITNYLIELLKDNECVIVPEFGAFISKRHSATIDYANHRFMPPYKELVFNNKLTNNDGLLSGYISQKENISEEESLAKIQKFVNESVAILDVNCELELEGLGKLRSFLGDYVFTTKEEQNLLGDSFGLTAFNYQPIFRTETYQVIKEKIVVEQKEKNTEYSIAIDSVEDVTAETIRRKPNLFRTLAYTTLAFLFIFLINWTTDKPDSQLASWNPFLYSSPNEYLIKVLEGQEEVEVVEELEVTEELEVVDELEVTEEPEVVKEPEVTEEVVPEIQNSRIPEIQKSYYIVGGSFQTEASAAKCVSNLKAQGFENASSLEKNNKGNIRVYYESFAEKADALIRLEEIKRDYNESAWLLFQK